MMWHELFVALALVLVIEGLLPFIKPNKWRFMMSNIVQKSDEFVRIMGLTSMLLGVVLLYIVRHS